MSAPLLSAVDIARLLGDRDVPTAEQAAAIEAPLAPALVVAGAGSGKTATMAGRVVWLLANGLVEPSQVLGLTFTRKAAGELERRVVRRLRALVRAATEQRVTIAGAAGLGLSDEPDPLGRLERPTVATYNAYAASLVADHALRLGREPGSRVLGEAARWQLADDLVEAWAEDLDVDYAVGTVTDAVLDLAGALDEHLLEPGDAAARIARIAAALRATPEGPRQRTSKAEAERIAASLEARARLMGVVAAFRERKRAVDAIDFGDQVALAARLARQVPEVRALERDRFRVVLLDEYQDTSYAQLELLRALFGDGHPVTAVGDPHQSIYGWRGASAGGLTRFPQDFAAASGASAAVFHLSVSFRNDRRVLQVANAVSGPLRDALAARVDVPLLGSGPAAAEGVVESRYLPTVDDEALEVAAFVAEHWRGPDGAGVGRHADAHGAPVTAAVLCRRRAQFERLHTALVAQGLPVEVVGLGGLLEAPEVVDLVSLLTAAHDPSRGDALMRLLTGARTRLGAADLHALAAWARQLATRRSGGGAADGGAREDLAPGDEAGGPVVERDTVDERSIVDAIDDLPPRGWRSREGRALSDEGRRRLAELAAVLRAVRQHTYLPLPELVAHGERLWGLDIEVAARPGVAPGRARLHLDAFAQVASDFARDADAPTLGAFLAWLAAAVAEERGLETPLTEPDPHAVQLLTVHGAKGLEWDVVAVPALVDGGLPSEPAGRAGYTASGWLTELGALPYPLRGDRDELPAFEYAGAADAKELAQRREDFRSRAGAYQLAEERRLAYVAVTRARSRLLLTGYHWGTQTTVRVPSPFLAELVAAGLVSDEGWTPAPPAGAGNPLAAREHTAPWPADPFAGHPERRAALQRAAAVVRAAAGQADPSAGATEWDQLADRLLAERAAAAAPAGPVELPAALSASALVRLERDPAAFAQALRRPVPQPPSPQARLGTAFHAWVEGYYGDAAIVDVEALPGADDDSSPAGADLAGLRESFLRTPWASLVPLAVEEWVETSVGGHVLRSRMDAVFPDPQVPGGVVVVDWKTGAPPQEAADRAARELQLAVYRLAWSRWKQVPLELVRAAFCYVGTGATVYPERLLDADEIAALLVSAAEPQTTETSSAPVAASRSASMPTASSTTS